MADKICTNCGVKLTFSNTSLKNNNICETCEIKLIKSNNYQNNNDLNNQGLIELSNNNKWNRLLFLSSLLLFIWFGFTYISFKFAFSNITIPIFIILIQIILPIIIFFIAAKSYSQIQRTKERGNLISILILILSGLILISPIVLLFWAIATTEF